MRLPIINIESNIENIWLATTLNPDNQWNKIKNKILLLNNLNAKLRLYWPNAFEKYYISF